MSVPPFLIKTFDLVSEEATDPIVSWSESGDSFIVWNNPEFSKVVLPKHFKHNNFSSFVRQLNTYGFKKIDPDRWEFMNPNFQRGRVDLLKGIQRRKGHSATHGQTLLAPGQPAIEVGQYGGLVEEVESLKRDKNVLMMELVHLRQKQQEADKKASGMKHRLEHTERRLSQLIAFFSNVASNPAVLAQMVNTAQASQAYLAGSEARRKKRRHDGTADDSDPDAQALVAYKQPVDIAGFFQNLMVSPMPEDAEPDSPEDGASDLEKHFNSINLRHNGDLAAPSNAARNGVTIRERSSPDETPRTAPTPDAAMAAADDEIEIPRGITAGVPSVGVGPDAAMPFSTGAEPASSGGFPQGVPLAAPSGSNGVMSIALDDLPAMSGDLLDADDINDILHQGTSMGYEPGDEEAWQDMLNDMAADTPPP